MSALISLQTDRLDKLWDEVIQPDIRRFQIGVAREVLAEEQRRGFDKHPRTIVDRSRYDAPVESVREFGVIEYVARFDIREVANFVWTEVVRRSPVDTGRYQDSHIAMINGVSVETLADVQPGDRVQIVNVQPYAKPIESGQSLMAPNGVYRVVYAAARRRFRGVMIDYKWVRLDLGATVKGAAGGRGKGVRHSRGRSLKDRPAIYPAIQIYMGQQ